MRGTFDFPTRVVFGPGQVRGLPALVRDWGSRPLLVTDRGVIGSGALQPVRDALEAHGIHFALYDGVEPNPTEENVLAAAELYRSECDFLIAVGGGSAIDLAKAVRLAATHEPPLAEYDDLRGGSARIRAELPPLIALPTTAGTGSEVGRSAVITIGGRKTVLFSPHLIPTVALCDPELTLDLPARMTAGTGADALTHNVEAYFARGFHPMCDAIALDGMARAMRWLRVAVREPGSLEARSEMMLAAMEGAVAFQKGLGVVHSLAHPLSSVAGLHHGTANAVMLPHALRFNRDAIAGRAAAAAAALGIAGSSDGGETVERIAAAFEELFADIGIPSRLRDLGVTSGLLGPMADLAMQDGCHMLNPREVARADMEALYRAAY